MPSDLIQLHTGGAFSAESSRSAAMQIFSPVFATGARTHSKHLLLLAHDRRIFSVHLHL
jgi:hypothetical protein